MSGVESITNVKVAWPTLGEVVEVLTLSAGYNTALVVIGTALLGIAAGTIGAFSLLRKRALMGDALSHATLPGIVAAFIISTLTTGGGKNLGVLLTGGAVTGVVAILVIQWVVRSTRLREDAVIGAVLSVFFGAGVVLLSYVQSMTSGEQGGLARFIYGQTAAMSQGDAMVLAVVAVLSITAAVVLYKEFTLVCFDDSFAATQGWPVSIIDLLMMALIVLVVVVGLQAVGLILVVAMLIIPPAAARFWTDRLGVMVVLSGVIGGLSGYLGSTVSALLERLPAGSVIVLTAGVIFCISMFVAPRRGLIAETIRRVRMRLRIGCDHALRTIYELHETGATTTPGAIGLAQLAWARGWSKVTARLIAMLLRVRRLARSDGTGIVLTDRGIAESSRVTRRHRLWEQYLITHAEIAPSHVDDSADFAEHALTPELVAELEAALRERGMLPQVGPVPSPHRLDDRQGGSA